MDGYQHKRLPVDEIEPSPLQLRPPGSRADAWLRASIERVGLLQPLIVVRNAHEGRWDVIDGNRRLAAARALGWDVIPCQIVREILSKPVLMRLAANCQYLVPPVDHFTHAVVQLSMQFDVTEDDLLLTGLPYPFVQHVTQTAEAARGAFLELEKSQGGELEHYPKAPEEVLPPPVRRL